MNKKVLLREFYNLCPSGICQDYLTESEKYRIKNEGIIYLTGTVQRADEKNGNGRVYSESILKREVENYRKVIEENRAVGELNHPDSAEIDLKNVCHIVEDLWWEGKDLKGKLRILKHHPSGQILEGLIKDNIKFGISSRGLGSVKETKEGIIVEEDFQLVCFDIVQEPSTRDAFLMKECKIPYSNRKLSYKEKYQLALIDILK